MAKIDELIKTVDEIGSRLDHMVSPLFLLARYAEKVSLESCEFLTKYYYLSKRDPIAPDFGCNIDATVLRNIIYEWSQLKAEQAKRDFHEQELQRVSELDHD